MKAVAAALVLVVGAAVVLWYGNTLNSWVLGGLIGGLAALLLSIPISLTIFSFLSRHHDQRSRSDEEYEPIYEYPEVPERVARSVYVVEEDRPRVRPEVWGEEDEWYEGEEDGEEVFYDRTQGSRRPSAQPRLPAPNQQRSVPRLPAPQQSTVKSTRQLSQTTRQLPERNALNPKQLSAREKEITTRRPTQQRMNYSGQPGYQPETQQSQMRSQALRTARMEAARQREEDQIEELPSHRSRRSPSSRSSRTLSESQYDEQEISQRTQQGAKQYPRRPRRKADAPSSQNGESQFSSQTSESTTRQSAQRQRTEPETDYLNPPMTNGNIKKPLVRRAPYMYEDDPLRKELSQQVEGPITRRSSRNLSRHQEEDR
ncbi:MAG: hypothetical protein H0U76_25180 [Ktedonobacteraceae bacterium]|nr:hypothetical protein [Ktedonobacteraceae bacterium]